MPGRPLPVWKHLRILIFLLFGPAGSVWAEPGGGKKLIEFGWDEPDTAFIHTRISEMERTPFSGCVFHAYRIDAAGKKQPFLWDCWSKTAFDEGELRQSLQDLTSTTFHTFRENFLRFNTAPGDVDWFDDYSATVHNVTVAARFAREGKCKGILFDTEQYNQPLFDYRRQRDARTKPWDEYARQVRQRGSEVMRAFQEGYPGVTIFLTFAYSLPFQEAGGDPKKLSQAHYGLLAPFLDGMLDAAQGQTRIVDGYESSYGFKDTSRFAKAYQTMSSGVVPIVADPQKYRRVFSFGFGVWMDENWRRYGWNVQDVNKNFYSPAAFGKTVRVALQASDEYVWIYTEKPKWWSESGGPVDLPAPYEQALREALGSINQPAPQR